MIDSSTFFTNVASLVEKYGPTIATLILAAVTFYLTLVSRKAVEFNHKKDLIERLYAPLLDEMLRLLEHVEEFHYTGTARSEWEDIKREHLTHWIEPNELKIGLTDLHSQHLDRYDRLLVEADELKLDLRKKELRSRVANPSQVQIIEPNHPPVIGSFDALVDRDGFRQLVQDLPLSCDLANEVPEYLRQSYDGYYYQMIRQNFASNTSLDDLVRSFNKRALNEPRIQELLKTRTQILDLLQQLRHDLKEKTKL